jgi:hypothetical protein
MSVVRRKFFLFLLCGLGWFAIVVSAHADDWLPISQDELKMTNEPKAPGAPAVYLYRQVDRDDQENTEHTYARIKILTDEGRKYSNVEIPFLKGSGDIKGIQARTIRPDGGIANFDGKVYEKMIVEAKGVKFLAKTFTLADVQPGSIIEYRYTRYMEQGYVFDSSWLLSEELFTKHAKFSLRRSDTFAVEWSWSRGLPEGTTPPKEDHHMIRLEADNIPAFQIEDYMPPQNEMKFRVDFMYTRNDEKDSDKFWKERGKGLYKGIEYFINRNKVMEQAVSQIVSPNDSPETKLRKIYARVQQIRNTSFEQEKTEQEHAREKQKETYNVEDVWKHGYGNGWDITWLFMALARAAGFEASAVLVSTRDQHFFNPKLMNPDDLNTNMVLVKLNGKDLYLDPGAEFTPFGMLPWHESAVQGLRLDKDGGSWIFTPLPEPAESRIERKASLQLTDSGSLTGKVTITFNGLSAAGRRMDEQNEDDVQRKKFLEDQIREYVPVPITVELTNKPDWKSSVPTLVAEFDIKIPDWATAAGRRTLFAVGLFGGGEKHLFEHTARVHPVYFSYPYEDRDDISIDLPPGWQISGLPAGKNIDRKVCSYHVEAEKKGSAVHVTRQLTVNFMMLDPKYYGALRNFYQEVRTGDEQQIILSASAATPGN